MNGKQKVAIVAGALVIALLALFPPWIARPHTGVSDSKPIRYWPRLSFTPPERPNETSRVPVPLKAKGHVSAVPPGSVRTLNLWPGNWPAHAEPQRDFRLMLGIQAAALVLSMAAVLVLKDKKS